MVRREDIPWEELQRLNAQGWSYRRLAEKYGVSSSAIGRQAVLESWHGTNDQRPTPVCGIWRPGCAARRSGGWRRTWTPGRSRSSPPFCGS